MTDTLTQEDPLAAAAAAANWDRVEELWLEALEASPIPLAELLEVGRQLHDDKENELAQTLLELLAEALENAGDRAGALEALRLMVAVKRKKSPDLVRRLEQAVASARADAPSVDRVLAHFNLREARRPLDVLEKVEYWLDHDQGTVVEVIGQGVGRVVDINLELENIRVDIQGKRPVSVPFGAASRYLRRLPEGDFLRRKVEEPEALRELVASSPGESFVQVLQSLNEAANVAAIKAALDGVLPASDWNTWWNKARRHPRVITTGSGSRLHYQVSESAEGATHSLLRELEDAGARDRLTVARRLAARGQEAAHATACYLAETLDDLESSDPGLAWETATTLSSLPGGSRPADACFERLLPDTPPLRLLLGIQDRAARSEVLRRLRDLQPEQWHGLWGQWFLHEEHPANLSLIASELAQTNSEDVLEDALETVFRNHLEHATQVVWACETMTDEDCPDAVRRRMTASVLELVPDFITRQEYIPVRSRAKALLDGGRVAIRLLLDVVTDQQAQRFEQRVARIGGLETHRLRLVQQAVQQRQTVHAEPEEPVLVATKPAFEAKRSELKQLLEVDIPKTLKGINAAAAEGDLRENFEYHMLRDRQELQSARAAKLQRELAEVRILEPGTADTSKVNIGTVIHLEDGEGRELAPITILGAWDGDVDRRVFANGSEIAQGLLGSTVGEEVEVEGAAARIVRIVAWEGERG